MQIRHTPLSGGYCGGVPPLPIPNREVKPTCADGTAMQCGRVGRRLLSMKSLRFRKISEAFLFFLLADLFLLRWGSSPLVSSSSGFFFIGFHGWIGRQSCLSDYSRIFADIWPLANGSRPTWAPIVFVTQISQMTQIFSYRLFCPTDFTDLHRFFLVLFFFLYFFISQILDLSVWDFADFILLIIFTPKQSRIFFSFLFDF